MDIKNKLRQYTGEVERQTAGTAFSEMSRDAVKAIVEFEREIAQLKDRIVELERYDRDGEIAGLRRDAKTLQAELLRAGQTIKEREDRAISLEKKLKTAKADGIRDAITDLAQLTDVDFLLLDNYANKLEEDNEN